MASRNPLARIAQRTVALDTPDAWGNIALTQHAQDTQADLVRVKADLAAANTRIDALHSDVLRLLARVGALEHARLAEPTVPPQAPPSRTLPPDAPASRSLPGPMRADSGTGDYVRYLALDADAPNGDPQRWVRGKLSTERFRLARVAFGCETSPATCLPLLRWLAEPDDEDPQYTRFTAIVRGLTELAA